MHLKIILSAVLIWSLNFSFSQKDSSFLNKLQLSGYLETYYSFDFSQPQNNQREDFFYSFDRHNEFNINLGCIKLAYEDDRVKSNLALMTGTYAKSNLAHEPSVYRMILEANISVKPFENRNDWITVGVFPSHIGFESAQGAECLNLTRSLSAENSPYYLAGIKYETSSKNEKWKFGLTVSNGWQRIRRQLGNQAVGLGHQLTYEPNKKITLNSSSYVGSEFPDYVRRMRYFHDFYAILHPTKKLNLIAGLDTGWEQQSKDSDSYYNWFTPTIIAQYAFNEKFSLAARAEYYSDQNEVIISTNDGLGFSTVGFSINADYYFTDQVLFRIEGRSLLDERPIYTFNDSPSSNNTFVTTSLSIKL